MAQRIDITERWLKVQAANVFTRELKREVKPEEIDILVKTAKSNLWVPGEIRAVLKQEG